MISDDTEAMGRLKRGDADALESLMVRHQDRALKIAYLVTHERSLAEDVVQQAFLRVYERARQFDADRPFEPWFTRIVINGALDATSKRRRSHGLFSRTHDEPDLIEELVPDPAPGPLQQAELAELRQMVWLAVQRLSPAQRAAVVQRYYLGLTDAEIASGSGRAVGTIKHLLHQARERLRLLLGGVRDVEVRDDKP